MLHLIKTTDLSLRGSSNSWGLVRTVLRKQWDRDNFDVDSNCIFDGPRYCYSLYCFCTLICNVFVTNGQHLRHRSVSVIHLQGHA